MHVPRFAIALLATITAGHGSASEQTAYYTNARLVSSLGIGCIVYAANDSVFQSKETRIGALGMIGLYGAYTALTGYSSPPVYSHSYGDVFNKGRYLSITVAGILGCYCFRQPSGGFAATAVALCALHKYLAPVNDCYLSRQWLNFLDPIALTKLACGMVATTAAYKNNGLPASTQLALGSLGILAMSDSLFTLGVNE